MLLEFNAPPTKKHYCLHPSILYYNKSSLSLIQTVFLEAMSHVLCMFFPLIVLKALVYVDFKCYEYISFYSLIKSEFFPKMRILGFFPHLRYT